VLRGIFGLKRDKVIVGWRKLHNEEFHNLYCLPSIITIIKSRRMRWAGHVARMVRSGRHVGFGWKAGRKDTTRKPRRKLEDNIKMDIGEKE
jgi:hypothetical protein